MTQGMQTTLCYITEVNNSNNYNAFSFWSWNTPGLEVISKHLFIVCKYSTRGGFVGVLLLWFVSNGQVAIRSLQVFGTLYLVISQSLQVKQEALK